MKLIFGTTTCSKCIELKKSLDDNKIEYVFYDLATSDGLAEAAIRNLVKQCEKSLPVVIDENNE